MSTDQVGYGTYIGIIPASNPDGLAKQAVKQVLNISMPGSKFDQHLELYHYLVTHTRIRLSDQKLEYYLFTDDTMMCIDHPDRKAWQISTSNMALRDALRILAANPTANVNPGYITMMMKLKGERS